MRQKGWRGKLADLITARASQPFVWGKNDCVLFAADCYEAVTGVDPASSFRGKYDSEMSALRAIHTYSGGNLTDACLKMLGYPSKRPPSDGDIVMVKTPNGDALGVFADARAVVVGEKGLIELPASQILSVWKV